MKHETVAEALGEIDQAYIAQAAVPRRLRWRPIAAAAAVLAVVLLAGLLPHMIPENQTSSPALRGTQPVVQGTAPVDLGRPNAIASPDTLQLSSLVAAPSYPEMVQKPNGADYTDNGEGYEAALQAWRSSRKQQYAQPSGYASSLADFWDRSLREFLSGQTENAAYSPVNVYMAMAMLAEITEGGSRQEILDLFGLSSIEDLRTQVSRVWNAHYSADGETTTVLANSLWLDSYFSYKQAAADTLAKDYFASVFHGDLGTEEMNGQLRQWLDSQTGGLLQEQVSEVELDPRTVIALASTVYFSAGWSPEFSVEDTTQALFHANGVDILTQFMCQTLVIAPLYQGADYTAVRLPMSGSNGMWLILPNADKTVDDVLASGEYLQMCTGGRSDYKLYDISLRMPKFDITGQMDLAEGFKNMGVTSVFDAATADFGAITDEPAWVGRIDHACRVAVDEEGCVAAAYTLLQTYGTCSPQERENIDFILDRPFLFVITSQDDLPLFAGVVNAP